MYIRFFWLGLYAANVFERDFWFNLCVVIVIGDKLRLVVNAGRNGS